MKKLLALCATAVLAGCASTPSTPPPPNDPVTLRVNVFRGASNLPIYMAQEKGYFARRGITLQMQFTPNSPEQRAGLAAGRFEIAHEPFALQDVLSMLADVLQSLAAEKGLWLRIHAVPPEVEAVVGDAQRVGQVLYNLTGNAIKFTERGGVDVRVEVLALRKDTVDLRFSVRDTGPGVAPDILPLLFSPFVQADQPAHKRLGGTGLGLAICRQLVTLMQGDIGVDTTPGQGSQFWFRLTLPTITASAITARLEEAAPGTQRLRDLRILIVDDAPVNREIARLLLEGEGATVETADDGQGAPPPESAADGGASLPATSISAGGYGLHSSDSSAGSSDTCTPWRRASSMICCATSPSPRAVTTGVVRGP